MDSAAPWRLTTALIGSAALHLVLMFGVVVTLPQGKSTLTIIRAELARSALPEASDELAVPAPAREPKAPPRVRPHLPISDDLRSARLPVVDAPRAAVEPSEPLEPLPPVEIPMVVDPTWYSAAELDLYPRALEPIRPAYPEDAQVARAQGLVTLLVLVDERGRVSDASVVEASPAGMFEPAALDALRAARFEPAQKEGRSVRSRIVVKVSFGPSD
jgi:protein TonB